MFRMDRVNWHLRADAELLCGARGDTVVLWCRKKFRHSEMARTLSSLVREPLYDTKILTRTSRP